MCLLLKYFIAANGKKTKATSECNCNCHKDNAVFSLIGRHKKSFFEALLQMTIDFLNNLIRDGIDVLETIDCHSMPMQILQEQKAKNFTFIVDIPESIAYLVECLKDIRPFITDLPNFFHRKEDKKYPTVEDFTAPKSLKVIILPLVTTHFINKLKNAVYAVI